MDKSDAKWPRVALTIILLESYLSKEGGVARMKVLSLSANQL